MKKIICLVAFIIFIANTDAQYVIKKNLADFNGIEIGSAAEVNLIQSDSNYVTISSKDSIKKTPKIGVHGGILEITSSSKGIMDVYVKNITSIRVSDAARVECKDTLKTDNLTIHVSDAASADILVHAKTVKAKADNGSSITIKGTTGSLDVNTSDAANMDGSFLKAASVRVISSNGSNASVWAINSIDANATDGSNITVKGSPAQKNTFASDGSSVTMNDSEMERHSMGTILDDDSIGMIKHRDYQMGEAFIGFGFVTGGNKNAAIEYGNSREFIMGFGGGHKFCKWNGLGFDVYYKSTDFYLAQNSGKRFPDTLNHDAEKVSLQNFGGLLYDRFIFTSGYHGQLALDLGFNFDWTFNSREVSWDNSSYVKTIDRNLAFFHHGNYGVTARLVFLRELSIYFNYRLSNVFKSTVTPTLYAPTLPPFVIGITIGAGG